MTASVSVRAGGLKKNANFENPLRSVLNLASADRCDIGNLTFWSRKLPFVTLGFRVTILFRKLGNACGNIGSLLLSSDNKDFSVVTHQKEQNIPVIMMYGDCPGK